MPMNMLNEQLSTAKEVVAVHSYRDDNLLKYATLLLPNVPFTEMDGTFINMFGMVQSFEACIDRKTSAIPAVEIYHRLHQKLSITGDYRLPNFSEWISQGYHYQSQNITGHISDQSIYRYSMCNINAQVRRSQSLCEAFPQPILDGTEYFSCEAQA